jgi:hypothetical protein
MRTSNKGMRDFEYRELAAAPPYDAVGTSGDELGQSGRPRIRAVARVGCTERKKPRRSARNGLPSLLLIPQTAPGRSG